MSGASGGPASGGRTAGRRDARRWLVGLLFLVAAGPLYGQSLAQRVERVRDGKVRFSFATRPDVCGNGQSINIVHATDDWEGWCQHGPARVQLQWRAGQLVDVDTYVGGRWREGSDVTDLGIASVVEASSYLLDLAVRVPGRVGDDLIFPATLADSVTVWPRLVQIARDGQVPRETRKNAVFWLGQAAGAEVTRGLGQLIDDTNEDVEVQESAVFALSQLKNGAGIPPLLQIARTHPSRKVRKSAMFWLSQSGDPRAISLFEEVLDRRR